MSKIRLHDAAQIVGYSATIFGFMLFGALTIRFLPFDLAYFGFPILGIASGFGMGWLAGRKTGVSTANMFKLALLAVLVMVVVYLVPSVFYWWATGTHQAITIPNPVVPTPHR